MDNGILNTSGFVVEYTSKRMKQHLQRILKDANTNITVDQWVVLHTLHEEDGLSQYEVACETGKDAPTITRIIDLLCQKELLQRMPNANDRRKFSLFLTEKGRQKIQNVLPIVKKYREKTWKGLTNTDLKDLQRILYTVISNLD